MQAMLARVTDPITYQGFQHFITHAVWDADRIWRRLLEVLPERRGVLIIDGTSFPKQGTHSVGVGRQVLRRAGQDRELPSRGDGRAVDGGACVDDGRAVVSPETLAQRHRPARGDADSDRRLLPGEMASGADVDPPRARGGAAGHGGARRRRVRRRHHLQASAAPLAPAVCRRGLSSSHRVPRHAGRPCPAQSAHGPAAIAVGARARHPPDRRARLGAGAAGARVATGDLAQRDESTLGGSLRGRPRDPRPRLARSTTGSRGLAVVRTGSGRHPTHQILFRQSAGHGVGEAIGPTRASTLGDRAAIPRAQDRTRVRPLRRPLVSRDGNIMSCSPPSRTPSSSGSGCAAAPTSR